MKIFKRTSIEDNTFEEVINNDSNSLFIKSIYINKSDDGNNSYTCCVYFVNNQINDIAISDYRN